MQDNRTNSLRALRTIAAGVIVIALLLTAASCGSPSFSNAVKTKMDGILDATMAANKIPGSVAGLWVPSQGTWFVAKGAADVRAGTPMKTSDKFRIASITKTFTATMVLILADEGKLALDDKVAKYVPDAPNAGNITIRQLLNHTSGMRDEDPTGVWQQYFSHTDQMLRAWTPMEVVQAYTGGKVQEQPGKGWSYSNAGYVVLGMVIEKASGQTVPDFCQEKIARPLGLKNTYFPIGPEITGEYAHGYDGTTDVTKMDMSWDFTAGAMISTAPELKVWAKAFATGKLLTPAMAKQQNTWIEIPGGKGQAKEGLGPEWTHGWIGHSGANIGFQSEMWYLPKNDATVVVLMNKLSSDSSDLRATSKVFHGVVNTVFPGTFPPEK